MIGHKKSMITTFTVVDFLHIEVFLKFDSD